MDKSEKIRKFIVTLQNLPEVQKKIIIFAVIIVFALIMGVFWIKSTAANISKIEKSFRSMSLPKIDLPQDENNFPSSPNITGVAGGFNKEAIDNILQNLNENQSQISDWETYQNNKYSFEIKYPKDWNIDKNRTTDIELHFSKQANKEQATIDMEMVSQTRKIKSAENALDNIVKRMKEVINAKKEIKVANYTGYETIGTLCTAICNGSSDGVYSLLSIIYFSDGKEVFYVDYIEGVVGQGYKNNIKDWKYYDEFKNIISTFKLTK